MVGASQGLGREIALALAGAGADVVCAARSMAKLQATAEAIEAFGRRALAVATDVTQEQQVADLVDRSVEAFQRIDSLFFCAGIMQAGSALNLDLADWERVLATNLTGAFLTCREAGKVMKTAGGGHIVLISSAFAGRVLPHSLAYGISKAGISQMVRNLSHEWARFGIRVNGIAPGWFDTDMPAAVLNDPKSREIVTRRIPLRRVGNPPEIGPLAVYLASDAADYMTGEIVVLDGGQANCTA